MEGMSAEKTSVGGRMHRVRVAVFGLAFCAVVCAGCAATHGKMEGVTAQPAAGQSIEEAWGIKDVVIRLTAHGTMLDFRFRIVDADKAAPLFNHDIRPYLVDESNGAILVVPDLPKVGAVRSTTRNPIAGQEHFILFANPSQTLKKGSKVVIVVGNFKMADLVVK
jgi:hypothetical protein